MSGWSPVPARWISASAGGAAARPPVVEMAAPREPVFDVLAGPSPGPTPPAAGLRRHPRAVPGPDPAGAGRQAAGAGSRQRHGAGGPLHPPRGRLGLVAQTVETVRFTRPEQVDFRLARGPIPHVGEGVPRA